MVLFLTHVILWGSTYLFLTLDDIDGDACFSSARYVDTIAAMYNWSLPTSHKCLLHYVFVLQ